jgi:hypothetical protein
MPLLDFAMPDLVEEVGNVAGERRPERGSGVGIAMTRS